MAVLGICQFLDSISIIGIKDGRFSVFKSPNGDGKKQFLIENTTGMVFIQKFVYGITLIFEKINGNTVTQNLVRPTLSRLFYHPHLHCYSEVWAMQMHSVIYRLGVHDDFLMFSRYQYFHHQTNIDRCNKQ